MPPVLILDGADESVVPVAEAYKLQTLLQQRQVPCQIEIFPNEGHWFSAGAQAKQQ